MIETYIIPLAVAALATAFGSWITELCKKWLAIPPLILNWIVGVIIFSLLIIINIYELCVEDIGVMTLTVLGWNVIYNRNILRAKSVIRNFVRGRNKERKGWVE